MAGPRRRSLCPPRPLRGGPGRVLATIALGTFGGVTALWAQPVGSLGIGASYLEYDGFLGSAAAVVAPAFRFDAARVSVSTQASWALFESGNSSAQGTVSASWLTGRERWWRFELAGTAGLSKYAREPGAGHALATARLHLFAPAAGGWVGASTGQAADRAGLGTTPVELNAALWTTRDRITAIGSATATLLRGERYLDMVGSVRWAGQAFEIAAKVGARTANVVFAPGGVDRRGFGELTAGLTVGRGLTVSVGAGSYLADPVRRVLGAKYLSAGLEVRTGARDTARDPSSAASWRRRLVGSSDGSSVRFAIAARGDDQEIAIDAAGATTVELMGDFTDWTAVALRRDRASRWVVVLPIASGAHRFNIRVDGGPWLVPKGARSETNEFGGTVAVLIIP